MDHPGLSAGCSAGGGHLPELRREFAMHPVHHPNFFEGWVPEADLEIYQLRVTEGEHERIIYDPYAFRSPLLTDYDVHLFAEVTPPYL